MTQPSRENRVTHYGRRGFRAVPYGGGKYLHILYWGQHTFRPCAVCEARS